MFNIINKKSQFRICIIVFALFLSMILVFTFKLVSRAEPVVNEVTYISIQINDGDTLNKIASRHLKESGLNHTELVREIVRINRLFDDSIKSGAYLIVPVLLNDESEV